MKIYLASTPLTLMSIAIASVTWGQEPPESASTRTRTAASETNQEEAQKIEKCIEELKAKRDGITDYSARKACRNHVKKEAERSEG